MSRLTLVLLCTVSFALAGSALPDLNLTHQLPEISDNTNKPNMENQPELSTSPEREENQREENVSCYTETPKQEIPSIPGINLSTSDLSDSNDNVCSLPPHLLLTLTKD